MCLSESINLKISVLKFSTSLGCTPETLSLNTKYTPETVDFQSNNAKTALQTGLKVQPSGLEITISNRH